MESPTPASTQEPAPEGQQPAPKAHCGRPKGFKVKAWSRADNAKLRLLYPKGSWEEILAALPGRNREAIAMYACKNEIRRSRVQQKRAVPGMHPVVATLIQARIDADVQIATLAKASGVSTATLFWMESGGYKPSFDTLVALAETLGYELTLKKTGTPNIVRQTPLLEKVQFDDVSRTVTFEGSTSLKMTKIEYAFVRHLIKHAPNGRTKEQIHFALYGGDDDGGPEIKIVDVWVCKVRSKISGTRLGIVTMHAEGYCIRDEPKGRSLNTAKGKPDMRRAEIRETLGLTPTATFRNRDKP